MEKVFCVSVQRSGTSSVGRFLRDNGYNVCGWPESKRLDLTRLWDEARTGEIFEAIEQHGFNAFEDSPWWFPGFHEEIYNRYPSAYFIHLERDPRAWFKSLALHSRGKNPGRAKVHAKIYNRETDLAWLTENFDFLNIEKQNILDITNNCSHYIRCYKDMNNSCQRFLEDKGAKLFHGRLETINWHDLGQFLDILEPFASGDRVQHKSTAYMNKKLESYVRIITIGTSPAINLTQNMLIENVRRVLRKLRGVLAAVR